MGPRSLEQHKYENHPKLKRFEVPHPDFYDKREHDFLEALALVLEQKSVGRWGSEDKNPEEMSQTREMLAEHVGGINMIARLVKERAQEESDETITSLNWENVDRIIQLHDLAEVIFGDKVYKNSFDEEEEDKAMQVMLDELEKRGVGEWAREVLEQYWERDSEGRKTSREANFVKTLDELEGIIHMFVTRRLDKDKRGYEKHKEFFEKYSGDFPHMRDTAGYVFRLMDHLKNDPAWALHAGQHSFDFEKPQ